MVTSGREFGPTFELTEGLDVEVVVSLSKDQRLVEGEIFKVSFGIIFSSATEARCSRILRCGSAITPF